MSYNGFVVVVVLLAGHDILGKGASVNGLGQVVVRWGGRGNLCCLSFRKHGIWTMNATRASHCFPHSGEAGWVK
jgi:hypothetical protein